ncbi:MAG: hypothetical protein AUJ92_21600 [Armatimonadetes bacterium CG2_30_59_28]|nr:D-amino acid aminotransferase [Armatimonadota bacterium]OIO89375.1 MAG: hypothetical protein AUJ92_21600 [Armatimonadetes bacterium CG2_30_59_28]PIU60731.1 MAG: D-amino-acid transaminase [Armatimonadetes bacterium CG07_land_8_20_14_0_80_59_28]PIX40776.1 MAG: D-amino-acid transaminase [Armatimonadetes bacterium CG_4_8_14_3_um_filter_58_9]PIY40490.1 MAG: D-amino-acid transaminase [Armatimonadetes bacterium CG_4_10_14_3_um_filter_59_10]PJB66829.1 MAG: D-amino-acid transaminase [Armatimonadetes
MSEIAYLNGQFTPIDEARVPIDDRGYQFGDGVYEVVRTYGGRLWALDRHLLRLQRSMDAIRITGLSLEEVGRRLTEANERAGYSEALIYFQVTRGVAPRLHTFGGDQEPTFLITVRRQHPIPESSYANGVAVITLPENRWERRDIKSINLLPNVLAKQRAVEQGVFEAIFVEGGEVNEGSSASLLIVREGMVWAPPLTFRALHGITRQLVVEIAKDIGIPVQESFFSVTEMLSANEVFLTGTGTEVLPVTTADGQPIADGRTGPVTKRLIELYRKRIAAKDDAVR